MLKIRPRAERDLASAVKGFLDAAGIHDVKIGTYTNEEPSAILSVRGKDRETLFERVGEIRMALASVGISLESDQHRTREEQSLGLVFPGFGMADSRGRYIEARTLASHENGGAASLLGKLNDGTVQLQVEAARGESFRDRLTAAPKAAGQGR